MYIGQDGGILAKSSLNFRRLLRTTRSNRLKVRLGEVLFCVLMDRDEVKVIKNAKRGQYPAILTEEA